MPFKSRNQERYLQINEPEIYRDWVEEYGHFKGAEAFSADFAGMKYELLVDETGNGLEEAEIVATYPTFEEAKNASQKLHSQTWIAETRFVGDTDEVIESTIIYGAESFASHATHSAMNRGYNIDRTMKNSIRAKADSTRKHIKQDMMFSQLLIASLIGLGAGLWGVSKWSERKKFGE